MIRYTAVKTERYSLQQQFVNIENIYSIQLRENQTENEIDTLDVKKVNKRVNRDRDNWILNPVADVCWVSMMMNCDNSCTVYWIRVKLQWSVVSLHMMTSTGHWPGAAPVSPVTRSPLTTDHWLRRAAPCWAGMWFSCWDELFNTKDGLHSTITGPDTNQVLCGWVSWIWTPPCCCKCQSAVENVVCRRTAALQ